MLEGVRHSGYDTFLCVFITWKYVLYAHFNKLSLDVGKTDFDKMPSLF